MTQLFRFLHAADLHLERAPSGLADVPDHLRSALIDAPYRAAERVFDAALKEKVDFVLLAGDVIDPLATGPRGLVFLTEQFQRLADQQITVYWAGGRSDHFERWLDAWPLTSNVVRFPLHRVQRAIHQRAGEPIAQILGMSVEQRRRVRTEEYHAELDPLFTVAVAHGTAEAESLLSPAIQYWALGSEHDRRTIVSGPTTAHYCGTPQGRRPGEPGPRGCTIVHVDETHRVRTTFVTTDSVRFQRERIVLESPATVEALHEALSQRAAELLSDPFGPELLVEWVVACDPPLAAQLTDGALAAQLCESLQGDFGHRRPAAWTLAVEADGHVPIDERHYDEESVLGEFLRTLRHYVDHPEAELSLEPFLAERHLAGVIGREASTIDPAARRRVLADVARLGTQLLSPQERRSS